jgi:DNA-binding transcriptional ArsR family regulator
MTDLMAVLAEPRRRDILRLVWSEERSAGDIAGRFPVTFGAVSQHLRVLREAGLVAVERRGKERWYRARRQAAGPLRGYLERLWRGRLETLKTLAEAEEHGR